MAAELTNTANDVALLHPMIKSTTSTLRSAGLCEAPKAMVADAGYWSSNNIDNRPAECPQLFVAVARHGRRGKPRTDGKPNTGRSLVLAASMAERLASNEGRALMRQRRTSIEPLFGQIKG